MTLVAAELTWTGDRFEPGIGVRIDADGRIAEVGRPGREPDRRLPRRALLPGFVNAHSHAFQRGLRGRGERFPAGAGSFWSWREAMYELVGRLDRETLTRLMVQSFREMLAGGITTVGEFHYLHHADPTGERRDFALDALVLEAAAEAGIRVVLIESYYRHGAIGQPLVGAQRRFDGGSPAELIAQMTRLETRLDPRTQSLGLSAHSLRAVGLDELDTLYAAARERGWVFHLHLEEQRQEIAACLEAYGRRPMTLVNDRLEVSPLLTVVHATHTDPEDLERYLAAGGNVCICPLTEANLGDGIAEVAAMLEPPDRLSLGTDSNARIAMLEEMRWLEYVQRLARERRGVVRDADGHVARRLLGIATRGGARSLGVDAGDIAPGRWADLVAVDLDAPSLAGGDAEHLLETLIFGGAGDAIVEVAVGGRWRQTRRARGG